MDSKKELDYFCWVYIVLAVLTAGSIFVSIANPNIISSFYSNYDFIEISPTTIIVCLYTIETLSYLFYFWLLKRIVNGKSKGIFVTILLILSIIGYIANLFQHVKLSDILSILVDVYVLYLIFNIRKESQK